MNRLHYFITQSKNWYYNGSDEFIIFFLIFFLEKPAFLISFFIHYCLIQLRYFWWNYLLNNISLLAGLLKLVCFLDRRYIYIMISDPQQNVGIHFLTKYVLQQQFLYCFTWSRNQFLILNIFSFHFLQTFLLINLISFCFDPYIFCHLLAVRITCFRGFGGWFWKFFVLFWTLCMLVTVHISCVMCHTHRE